ncbi:MAG: hypothetical protein HC784_05360 [Hydrococcus sp. CSU_1_8]|nr:hypothetical protein [Hydrococcus sp. CSU_1_8]
MAIDRLERAWNRVILQHEMLRCIILPNGEQKILAEVPPFQIEIIDLRGLDSERVDTQLEAIRSRLAYQVRQLDSYPCSIFAPFAYKTKIIAFVLALKILLPMLLVWVRFSEIGIVSIAILTQKFNL